MDYRSTLNITLGDRDPGAMPQRGGLPVRELEIQRRWAEIGLYRLSIEKDARNGSFILHDGPPYSNGHIHLGHALNKIAKDIIVKYKTLQGYRAPYVPGWDNHGMPIENNVARELMGTPQAGDRAALRRRCREYAAEWVDVQRGEFQRLGVRGDWDHPYLTMSPEFEGSIIDTFGALAEKGFIYRGMKPVLWCAHCRTALADAEVEYGEHTSNSIYVRFPVIEDPGGVFGCDAAGRYVLVWTTTPWTIPANLALAVHTDAEYAILELETDRYLVARALAAKVLSDIGHVAGDEAGQEVRAVRYVRGSELEGLVCRHPLFERPSPVVYAPYVTMEDGTGVVHTAPGHGKEDFDTGRQYGLPVLCPVDGGGAFTGEAGDAFVGARILGGEADRRVMDALAEAGHLLSQRAYSHSYPHCWRCHHPLLFRATVQWFMDIDHDQHRERCVEAIGATEWVPPVSANRIRSMVQGRPDWCLSRQRAWGVGIPAFYCRSCGDQILDPVAIRSVADHVRSENADVWYTRPSSELLPPDYGCPSCGSRELDKETDILDVWFDSGATHLAVLEDPARPDLTWPADVYLEGSDQHRGWFNSSLMVGVGVRGRAPYNTVITNGWTLDENGRAMHKSLGNVVSPNEIVAQYGADVLRLWAASVDYFEDVRCSPGIIKQASESYRQIRNTLRFLVNNLADSARGFRRFDPAADGVPCDALYDLDRWAIARLDELVATCRRGYDAYEFHRVYHAVHHFCSVDLSAFYLDVIKDRLYCERAGSLPRRSAQTALFSIARALAIVLAPILSHTADEVWQLLGDPDGRKSAQLADWPEAMASDGPDTIARWEPVLQMRALVNLAVEAARQEKRIGNPLESAATIRTNVEMARTLAPYEHVLASVYKVSAVEVIVSEDPVATTIDVTRAPGVKCARCWLIKTDVGLRTGHSDLCGRCADAIA